MAESFAGWLRSEGVTVSGIDGRNVQIPTSYPPFAWDVAEIAVQHEWADDSEACRAVNAFLEGAGVR
jgi:hypothetical protein